MSNRGAGQVTIPVTKEGKKTMGEYGTRREDGEEIKIGTCEDMYYLRADQVGLVESSTLRDITTIRFRFPFPDEDHVKPGEFDPYNRGAAVWDVEVPSGCEHYRVQFVARVGFNVSLPCPLSPEGKASGLPFHANGFAGPVKITQQRAWAGVWVTVCECGACGAAYRLPTLLHAQPIIDACKRKAKGSETDTSTAKWWQAIADRIEEGYRTPVPPAEIDH